MYKINKSIREKYLNSIFYMSVKCQGKIINHYKQFRFVQIYIGNFSYEILPCCVIL